MLHRFWSVPAGRHDWVQASSNPAIRSDAIVPSCDGKTKKTTTATTMSKAPVVWRAYPEFLLDRVSWPMRWLAREPLQE